MKYLRAHRLLFAFLTAAALTGCASSTPVTHPTGGSVRQLNEGYTTLYKLMCDESGVDKILIIKHAGAPLSELIKQISAAAASAQSRLEDFRKSDSLLQYDLSDLPPAEEDARALTRKEQTTALLTTSGSAFELQLIYTQLQAMDYAAQLSKSIASRETTADRRQFLADLSRQCADFTARLMPMLTVTSK